MDYAADKDSPNSLGEVSANFIGVYYANLLFGGGANQWVHLKNEGRYYLNLECRNSESPFKQEDLDNLVELLHGEYGIGTSYKYFHPTCIGLQISDEDMQRLRDQGLGSSSMGKLAIPQSVFSRWELVKNNPDAMMRERLRAVLFDPQFPWDETYGLAKPVMKKSVPLSAIEQPGPSGIKNNEPRDMKRIVDATRAVVGELIGSSSLRVREGRSANPEIILQISVKDFKEIEARKTGTLTLPPDSNVVRLQRRQVTSAEQGTGR